jgi:STE24 endopeptidase
VFALIIWNQEVPKSFGFSEEYASYSSFVYLYLFLQLYYPIGFLMNYLNKAFTRKCEYEADAFAVKNGHGDNLVSALITLFKKNKSRLIVDDMYSALYLTHPTLVERIKAIKANKHYVEQEMAAKP